MAPRQGRAAARGSAAAQLQWTLAATSFVYDESFLRSSVHPISPDLPLDQGRIWTPDHAVLPGAIADTTPDDWGRWVISKAAGDISDENGEPGLLSRDAEYDYSDFARESVDKAGITLATVINAAPSSALLHRESSLSLGHGLALTQWRHGAGFWDRGMGHDGDRLTDAAHEAGETNLEVGDDGQVHLR